ncbi:MAG TPA: replication-associated recombination protein A [Vitreimonas sp.]|nr:replication-associated recombination protein A [Vitreimonas sp.]
MKPLAAQLRPTTLDEFMGQSHLVGPNQPLRIAIEQDKLFSMILWGPPGVGKTTLAQIMAHQTQRNFYELSAVSAGKSDVREIIDQAQTHLQLKAPVLFIDEIHRFNKAQQDFLLPYVENGTVILIGATTENPSFEVISALLSRSRVFVLKSLNETELKEIIERALPALQSSYNHEFVIDDETQDWLVTYANGDARKLLTMLDNTAQLYEDLTIETFKAALQSNQLRYDKGGEEHYDTISAFIKSMRASNTDAALYYLARMVDAGEDPKFIARRMVIFASEDIGLAVPTALVVANAVFEAVTKIGYPEAQINLAHGVAYLCQCTKDRSAYDAYFAALADVKALGNLAIPLELRNAPTKLMKNLDYGKGYEMYPDKNKSLLPDKLKRKTYFKKPQSK